MTTARAAVRPGLAACLLALAACSGGAEGRYSALGVEVRTNVTIGRERDDRLGIERAGDACLLRDRHDAGGLRLSQAC